MFSKYIDIEAKQNAGVATDLDNFRNKYLDISTTSNLTVILPGFSIYTIEKNLYLLYANSEKVNFKSIWEMRPDYVSYEYYGTVIYWWLILYINRVDSIEDFTDLENIYIPSFSTIQKLLSDIVPEDEFVNITQKSSNIANKYYKRYPLDKVESDTLESREALLETNIINVQECILKEKTETFILTSTDINNKYIDLEYVPVNYSSISFYIGNYTEPQSYGYDYILKYIPNTTDSKRISWSVVDCSLGNGLEDILESGDIIKIIYIYSEVGCNPCVSSRDCIDGGILE